MKIQWIQIRKEEPLKLYFKYTVQEDVEFRCVNFAKRGNAPQFPTSLTALHAEPRPVAVEKFRDIQKLMKYVPPIYHAFYEQFRAANVADAESLDAEDLDSLGACFFALLLRVLVCCVTSSDIVER